MTLDGQRIEPVRAACIRTLFQQIPNSFAAAGVVTVYMVATAAPFSPPNSILIWLALQVTTQVLRLWLVRLYRRIPADDDGRRLEIAARRNTLYMLTAGLVWGSTAFFFMHVGQPITAALTLCGLYGISGVSVELTSGLEAAETAIAAGARFDACLTDYRLAGPADGLAVIARLAARPDAPGAFCLITGDMSPDILAQADAAGVRIIHKPLHPASLRALLNHLVAGGQPDPVSVRLG
ncbi:hypothetical protein [Phenylobacterium sp.]|uniref:hypothetical protein n=1 Tax=Phenylobacterium sp. TaxID=1871053 RepID=UPI0025FC9065|nr:hypothetical protein [Phenylobacterium sp.]